MCNNCRKKEIPCEREQDGRKIRLKTSEIERLRSHVSTLQNTISNFHNTISRIQQATKDENSVEKIKEILGSTLNIKEPHKFTKKLPVSIARSAGSYSVFGPTSAFYNVVDISSNSSLTESFDNGLMSSSLLLVCLSNFFKWQYPDIATFIHRESFLNEFLNPQEYKGYCSEELVYAIAALGAKCSDDESLRNLSQSFFETSKSKIFSKKICVPHVNTLQALLCLSLFELGDGNASASWMLSGMAIRMGYDLGFQLNPRDWTVSEVSQQDIVTNMDVMVRSRIYWGTYVFDHFISLVMGRPVTVRKSEASIPSSEHLPNSEGIEDFVFQPLDLPDSVQNVDASKSLIPLCSLSECIGALLSDIYSNESGEDSLSYLPRQKIEHYNLVLAEWRSTLPPDMKWTKNTLKKQAYNPTLMNVRLYYYVVLLCLNRPFMNETTDSSSLCHTATSELAICLSKFNLSGYPPSILIVYSSILAISVILMKLHTIKPTSEDLEDLRACYVSVARSCSSWKLASQSLIFIRKNVTETGLQEISQIFAEETNQNEMEMDHIMDDLWDQDNLMTNFFDFLNYEEGRE